MTIFVGMTQDLAAAREFLLKQQAGMYPDVEMGPFKKQEEARDYILFMQKRFPGAVEIDLPRFSVSAENSHKWYVFSFEHSGKIH